MFTSLTNILTGPSKAEHFSRMDKLKDDCSKNELLECLESCSKNSEKTTKSSLEEKDKIENRSKNKDRPQNTTAKFFKRKLFDVDQNLVENFDSHLKNLKHRTFLQEKMYKDKAANKIDRLASDKERNVVKERKKTDKNAKDKHGKKGTFKSDKCKDDKQSNKSKKMKSSKFSRWFYGKFKHSDSEESNDSGDSISSVELNSEVMMSELMNEKSSLLSKISDDESVNKNVNSDNVRTNTKNKLNEDKFFENDNSSAKIVNEDKPNECNSNQRIYTNQLYNLRKKLLKTKRDDQKNDTETSSSSSENECDCCKNKVKKLKLERVKLRNQLRRKSRWKKCIVFLNPIFLLAVFFYLLYSELTAVRAAETTINLTSPTNEFNNLLNKVNLSSDNLNISLEQLINLKESKKFDYLNDKSDHKKVNKILDQSNQNVNENLDRFLDKISDKTLLDNESNQNEDENLEFYSSSLNKPLRIPISKRNFFNNFNANSKPNQQFIEDALLLNKIPPFKILAILPTTFSPQLSRHLHRSMELYYAYTEGLVSSLELAQYFEHLKFPNGLQSDLSSALHHLQINTTITSDHHHNDKIRLNLLHSNHSELNYEDHLFTHLIQRIHHRNRTQHHSESNSLYSAQPSDIKPPFYNDPLYNNHNNNPHFNEKQLTEHFIQINRKRLRPISNNYQTPSLQQQPSLQFSEFSQQPEIQLSLLPLGNSSIRLINSLCDSIEIQRPSLILSLVDSTRNYYLEMLARIGDIPMLTLTSEYQETATLQKLLMEVILCEMKFFYTLLTGNEIMNQF